jgi:methyl coenzyme M reductase alpha subunit
LLTEKLKDVDWSDTEFIPTTVHRSQGLEADISVICLTANTITLDAETEFQFDAKAMNVALSRARRKAVIIIGQASLQYLNASESTSAYQGFSLLQHLHRECVSRGSYHEVDIQEIENVYNI